MHLKVAVVVAVTDYRKLRYCHVGNCRLYLIRNARILERTTDQSLTQNLVERDRVILIRRPVMKNATISILFWENGESRIYRYPEERSWRQGIFSSSLPGGMGAVRRIAISPNCQ